jgi:hypothetical protein
MFKSPYYRRKVNKSNYKDKTANSVPYCHIPPEYFCNPYDISPSGDMFWADRRNVEELKKAIEAAEEDRKEGRCTVIRNEEEFNRFFDSL